MNYTHGLSGEIFNPGQEALDDQGAFANVQQKRVNAAQAFIRADSDAKLRRAFTQKFVENRDEVVVGQRCWYWRDAGAGILRKARWRGPARVVAVEPVGDSKFCGCAMELRWCVVDHDKFDQLLKKQVLQFLLTEQQPCVTLKS